MLHSKPLVAATRYLPGGQRRRDLALEHVHQRPGAGRAIVRAEARIDGALDALHDEARHDRLVRVAIDDAHADLAAGRDVELELGRRSRREAHRRARVRGLERREPLHRRDRRLDREAPLRVDRDAHLRAPVLVETDDVRALLRSGDDAGDARDRSAQQLVEATIVHWSSGIYPSGLTLLKLEEKHSMR